MSRVVCCKFILCPSLDKFVSGKRRLCTVMTILVFPPHFLHGIKSINNVWKWLCIFLYMLYFNTRPNMSGKHRGKNPSKHITSFFTSTTHCSHSRYLLQRWWLIFWPFVLLLSFLSLDQFLGIEWTAHNTSSIHVHNYPGLGSFVSLGI